MTCVLAAPRSPSAGTRAEAEGEQPLDGVLAEFREALNAEVEAAANSAASSAVPLINGKRIGLVGTFTHYAFTVESALMLPTDAQGDLHIHGQAPVAGSVISIEGLAVTVSVSEDFGPFVPFARLQSDMVYLLRSLIRRIEDYGEQKRANPAGNRLLGVGEVHGEAVDLKSALSPELKAVSEAAASTSANSTPWPASSVVTRRSSGGRPAPARRARSAPSGSVSMRRTDPCCWSRIRTLPWIRRCFVLARPSMTRSCGMVPFWSRPAA